MRSFQKIENIYENQNESFIPFLLFLNKVCDIFSATFSNLSNKEISNLISKLWISLSKSSKAKYRKLEINMRENPDNSDVLSAQKKRKISDHFCQHPQYLVQNSNLIRTILSCTLPLSNFLRTSILDAYNQINKLIQDEIIETLEFVALTLDFSTSYSYFGITCHWLTHDFKLIEIVLDVPKFSEEHAAAEIFEKFQFQLFKFRIARENIVSITIENKDNNIKPALSQLQIEIIPYIENNWKSVYQAIHHLIILQPSILNLSREDEKLKENILSEDEIDICKELGIVLLLFYELTEMLKHSKYPALSFMTLAIENIKQQNLKKNFDTPAILGLCSSFFDPRFKKLLYIESELRCQIINNLREQFSKLLEPTTSNPETINKDSKMLSFFHIFIQENRQTEFDKYLELPQLDVTEENNPLIWWSKNKHLFPTMAKLARKYLSIPAFSTPSDGLFPDKKNQ
ncbi:7168_t:CDS:2, partial [Gigaspora margarita]